MEPKNSQLGSSSSSSLTSQLFGSQDSSSSSSDVLASIFPPNNNNKGMGRNSGPWQKEPSANQTWNNRQGTSYKHGDATYGSSASKEHNSIYQQEGAAPCHLSSSLYYGGRDNYSKSQPNQNSTSYPTAKKDGGDDEPIAASRGNWWQGSLYY